MSTALVTGGSGYFGELLVRELCDRGDSVRVLDLNDSAERPPEVEFMRGDIRDPSVVEEACQNAETVYHNVAQVPLAKDAGELDTVNVGGTENLLEACLVAGVRKTVHTSSSAIFGVPDANPVDEETPARPVEAYGIAKWKAELACRAAVTRGLDVTIIRPRTILGHGRLGIFSLLFDFVADDADVFVLGGGDNRYQFVHASDLARACLLAGDRPGASTYNIGASEFGTMREALEGLLRHAGASGRVRSLPMGLASAAMRVTAQCGMTPFAPYHWMMYGRSLWFDTSRAEQEFGWVSRYSTDSMLAESYDWYLEHRDRADGETSFHRSPVNEGVLRIARRVLGS